MVIAIEHRFRLVAARLFLIRLLAFGVGDASVLQAVQRESLLARDHFGVHGGVQELTGFDVLQHWSFAHDRMQPWHTKHLVCIGDAAHAFDPQLGVGANMALADAITLAAVLHHATPPQVPHALASYRAARESQLRTYNKATASSPHCQNRTGHSALLPTGSREALAQVAIHQTPNGRCSMRLRRTRRTDST
ncbi:FAD-dependent oxidoreductase [Steroidobacter cummioxidans]|uniref:FAD-dependent oxidoreductase n=1 Tax=Steroidobacter cummioxidans TaxID=1803913 RepID=UPI0019D45355